MAAGLRVSKLKGQRVLVVEVFDELGFLAGVPVGLTDFYASTRARSVTRLPFCPPSPTFDCDLGNLVQSLCLQPRFDDSLGANGTSLPRTRMLLPPNMRTPRRTSAE